MTAEYIFSSTTFSSETFIPHRPFYLMMPLRQGLFCDWFIWTKATASHIPDNILCPHLNRK